MASATAVCCGLEEVLLDGYAYIGSKPNHTTAGDLTTNFEWVVVSFWRERPPLPSRLYVDCPDLDPGAITQPPRILCVVEGLILFRVAIRCRDAKYILPKDCHYFVYDVRNADLQGIPPNPSPVSFDDDEVGLLPRGNQFTVAALVSTCDQSVYTLHTLHSENGIWTSMKVSLETPQKDFPMTISKKASRFLHHSTSTVITLGGEKGTIGWVDLWRGILLCDVLGSTPELRGVPLPLPNQIYLGNGDETSIDFQSPKQYRGIAFIKKTQCLRFVDLDIPCQPVPDPEDETVAATFRFDGWTLTTWSNSELTDSFEDWNADNIELNDQLKKQLLDLLRPKPSPQNNNMASAPKPHLKNFWVFQPTPSIDESNVVFLIAKADFLQPDAHALAVDMESKQLQGVAEFGIERELCGNIISCHGSVSSSSN